MSEVADDTPMHANILKAARSVSNLMALWALCRHRACRRLGQCRAVPLTCWDECIELAPAAVSEFVFTLFAQQENFDLDDALARVPEEVGEEWQTWHEAVRRMTGPRSYKPRRDDGDGQASPG
jgi:hypothetical protein